MSIEQTAEPVFAGHQTFHPRFGWIKKGYDAACSDPEAFTRPDATVRLGVGKNMVESIRFWTAAFRVVKKVPNPERPRMSVSVPTCIGEALIGTRGVDPYIEDTMTLAVLHWLAVSTPSMLPAWQVAFSDFNAVEFQPEVLTEAVETQVASTTWKAPNRSSLSKDTDCLLRMYAVREVRNRESIDELLDSPFRELGLLMPSPAVKGTYRFVRGHKPSLPADAVLYACLDFMATTDPHASTMSISRLLNDETSPGRLFKLTDEALRHYLDDSVSHELGVAIATPAGSPQLVVHDDTDVVAARLFSRRLRARGLDPMELSDHLTGPAARETRSGQQQLEGSNLAFAG